MIYLTYIAFICSMEWEASWLFLENVIDLNYEETVENLFQTQLW